MIKAKAGLHHRVLAQVLGTLAAWSYADLDTFSRAVLQEAFIGPHEAVSVNTSNPALLVNTTAYLVRSMDGRLAILCFRGTDPNDFSNWLADISISADHFFSAGKVHGGFLRSTLAVWRPVEALLKRARSGSICDAAVAERARFVDCMSSESPPCQTAPSSSSATWAPDKLEALYITGHSLGGAMAVIAAALLHADPEYAFFRDKLRGIYTFGQPMIGCKEFAEHAKKDFGDKLFRHVYRNDLVPALPPLSTGRFMHFGSEYSDTEHGWVYNPTPVAPARLFSSSVFLGLLAWFQAQLPEIPVLRHVPFPWSLRDHGPIYYLRTSQATAVGAEFI